MAKHTEGRWATNNNPNSNYGFEIVADVKVKAKRVVCRVGGPDREANARLIAAAPDLLAALRYAVDNPEFNSETFDNLARAAIHLAKHGAAPATTNEEDV